jgi:hypothetical protein
MTRPRRSRPTGYYGGPVTTGVVSLDRPSVRVSQVVRIDPIGKVSKVMGQDPMKAAWKNRISGL